MRFITNILLATSVFARQGDKSDGSSFKPAQPIQSLLRDLRGHNLTDADITFITRKLSKVLDFETTTAFVQLINATDFNSVSVSTFASQVASLAPLLPAPATDVLTNATTLFSGSSARVIDVINAVAVMRDRPRQGKGDDQPPSADAQTPDGQPPVQGPPSQNGRGQHGSDSGRSPRPQPQGPPHPTGRQVLKPGQEPDELSRPEKIQAFLDHFVSGSLNANDTEFLTKVITHRLNNDTVSANAVSQVIVSTNPNSVTVSALVASIIAKAPALPQKASDLLSRVGTLFASPSTATVTDFINSLRLADVVGRALQDTRRPPRTNGSSAQASSEPSDDGVADGFAGFGDYSTVIDEIVAGQLSADSLALIRAALQSIFSGPAVDAIVTVLQTTDLSTTSVSDLVKSIIAATKGLVTSQQSLVLSLLSQYAASDSSVSAFVGGLDQTSASTMMTSIMANQGVVSASGVESGNAMLTIVSLMALLLLAQ